MNPEAPSPLRPSRAPDAPLVSILIPAWGCARYIARSIRSAFGQTYANIEVLVSVDDGDSLTLAEATRAAGTRAKVTKAPRRLGQYGNKNYALSLARGELVKFVDGDDELAPDAVETLVRTWRACRCPDVVFGNFVVIDAEGRPIGRPAEWGFHGRCSGPRLLEAVLRDGLPGNRFGNVTPHLFTRCGLQRIGGFPHDNAGPGDVETIVRLMLSGDVGFVDRTVASYRVHGDSMSNRSFGLRECEDYVRMVERLQPEIEASDLAMDLRSDAFNRQWRVWAGGHVILAALVRLFRDGDPTFLELRRLYAQRGLRREFRAFVVKALPGYFYRTLRTKARRRLGQPDAPPLFHTAEFRSLLASDGHHRHHAAAA